jgi:SAM-dependent methyltransferase
MTQRRWRWRVPAVRRILCPPNRLVLDPWIAREAARLTGLVVNVGSGEDLRQFGRRTVHVDAHAPTATVRADFLHALPFAAGSFDAALCTEVLEHVPDDRALLAELARVLKPGGVLVVTVPFMFRYHPDPEDYRRYTPVGLRAELVRAGFTVERAHGVGGRPIAFLLWLDGLHFLVRVPLRALLAPFRGAFAAAAWRASGSVFAANSVAVARR